MSDTKTAARCDRCRHAAPADGPEAFNCMRNPPLCLIVQRTNLLGKAEQMPMSYWPLVRPEWRCGEFREIEAAPAGAVLA